MFIASGYFPRHPRNQLNEIVNQSVRPLGAIDNWSVGRNSLPKDESNTDLILNQ